MNDPTPRVDEHDDSERLQPSPHAESRRARSTTARDFNRAPTPRVDERDDSENFNSAPKQREEERDDSH